MVFYENSGLQNLYDIVRFCQVLFSIIDINTVLLGGKREGQEGGGKRGRKKVFSYLVGGKWERGRDGEGSLSF
jgi:hypothetical protein